TVMDEEGKSKTQNTGENWDESKYKVTVAWSTVQKAYDRAKSLAHIVCAKDTREIFDTFGSMAGEIASKTSKGDLAFYKSKQLELFRVMVFAWRAVRVELGVDPGEPESSRSSAGEGPAPPSPPAT